MTFQSPLPDKIRPRDLNSVFSSLEKDFSAHNLASMLTGKSNSITLRIAPEGREDKHFWKERLISTEPSKHTF